jgi:DNA-binding IclR family transcriptional regulator
MLLREIAAGPRAFATLAVWYALAPYVRRDTAEVICTQRTLARTAGVSLGDVHRALARLVEMGALTRESRGQYRVHPALMWKGELAKRERAEAMAPELRVLEGGKVLVD